MILTVSRLYLEALAAGRLSLHLRSRLWQLGDEEAHHGMGVRVVLQPLCKMWRGGQVEVEGEGRK